ncbi:MAG: hypothetical protein Ct9H300mP28_33150 [Pseudomonadota bacterium]|nr:MAG: hypothetical protein Ct9H300mP28_33150 [Pseudomonadota bacterium]
MIVITKVFINNFRYISKYCSPFKSFTPTLCLKEMIDNISLKILKSLNSPKLLH